MRRLLLQLSCFNPRPRVEGDMNGIAMRPIPVRFNPRPRVEGDSSNWSLSVLPLSFNPRPRVEGDRRGHVPLMRHRCFNPRPRVEGDTCTPEQAAFLKAVSIRALAWRATEVASTGSQ